MINFLKYLKPRIYRLNKEIKKNVKLFFYIFYLNIYIFFKIFFFNSNNQKLKTENSFILLAWQFPPLLSGGVFRAFSIAKYSAILGWNVTVICQNIKAGNKGGDLLLKELDNNINIIKVNKAGGKNIIPFLEIDGGYLNSLKIVKEVIEKVDILPKAIISTGPPFHTFLAGKLLKKYYNCKLLLDYRDEWNLCPFDFVEKNSSNLKWERKILKKSDLVVFVTKGIKKVYNEKFHNEIRNKSYIIYNGWDEKNIYTEDSHKNNIDNKRNKKVVISYAGSLKNEPIEDFLILLDSCFSNDENLINDFVFQFIGKKSTRVKYLLNNFKYQESIESVEQLNKNELNMLLSKSNAFLLLLNDKYFRALPGKMFEYLSFYKPIICFANPYFEAAKLIKYLNAGTILNFHQKDLFYEELYNLKQEKYSLRNNKLLSEFLINNTRKAMTKKLLDLIQ